MLKCLQIFQVPLATRGRNAADRQRPIAIMSPGNLHHRRLFQHAEMPAEITIRKRAKLLEIVESDALRIRNKLSKHAETRAFVDDAIEPFVR